MSSGYSPRQATTSTHHSEGTTVNSAKRQKVAQLNPLFLLLQRHPHFVIALSESISANECDFMARILLTVTEYGGYRMRLIKSLISHELSKYQHSPQNIFRSNSLASTLFVHTVVLFEKICVCVARVKQH